MVVSSRARRGDNQRLELLGDTVLKFVTSDYLMRHFPRHHEGHLSLLRSALVNRTTEAIVCDELCMQSSIFAPFSNPLSFLHVIYSNL